MGALIATWLMAENGAKKAIDLLNAGKPSHKALIELIKDIEDDVHYKSVGYGGLPNREGVVELDSAFMDGDDLSYGGVGALKNIKNPIEVAYLLSKEKANNFLVGQGAYEYALDKGFKPCDLLSAASKKIYEDEMSKLDDLKVYDGHDTVGCIVVDDKGKMCAGTSTSGLFLKHAGRLGDSALIGSGLYVDSAIGGASATGMGEDIMKGCLSYEVVMLMRTMSPSEACRVAVSNFSKKLEKLYGQARDISIVAMNNKGQWGAYSNIDTFSFVAAGYGEEPKVYLFKKGKDDHPFYTLATKDDIARLQALQR